MCILFCVINAFTDVQFAYTMCANTSTCNQSWWLLNCDDNKTRASSENTLSDFQIEFQVIICHTSVKFSKFPFCPTIPVLCLSSSLKCVRAINFENNIYLSKT